jgi:hypothetical protein
MKRITLVLALVILGCSSSSKRTHVVDTPYSGPEGAIRGVVIMPDGSTLPGVVLSLHTSHGDLTQVSDARGRYEFINVVPGVYHLSADLAGFGRRDTRVTVQRGIATGVMTTLNSAVTESITVTAEAAPLSMPNVTSVVARNQSGCVVLGGRDVACWGFGWSSSW